MSLSLTFVAHIEDTALRPTIPLLTNRNLKVWRGEKRENKIGGVTITDVWKREEQQTIETRKAPSAA